MESTLSRRTLLTGALASAVGLIDSPPPLVSASLENPSIVEPGENINGVVTFGHQKPLLDNERQQLFDQLNAVEVPMENDIYYATMVISERTYTAFQETHNETFQAFLKRHELEMNRLLMGAAKITGTQQSEMAIRRLIILDDMSEMPDSFRIGYLLSDSDGGWNFTDRNDPEKIYVPEEATYVSNDPADENKIIDYGLLHEWGHALFALPDEYTLDVQPTDKLSDSFSYMPDIWRYYRASERPDIGNDLMSIVASRINMHTAFQLGRRLQNGGVRSKESYKLEAGPVFPNEMPDTMIFQFGKEFADATINAYTSNYFSADDFLRKDITKKGTFNLDNSGSIKLDRTFFPQTDENLIAEADGVYFFEVIDMTGKYFYRWMDIRDLNIAYWEGHKEKVNMAMKLVDPITMTPDTFDWRIVCA